MATTFIYRIDCSFICKMGPGDEFRGDNDTWQVFICYKGGDCTAAPLPPPWLMGRETAERDEPSPGLTSLWPGRPYRAHTTPGVCHHHHHHLPWIIADFSGEVSYRYIYMHIYMYIWKTTAMLLYWFFPGGHNVYLDIARGGGLDKQKWQVHYRAGLGMWRGGLEEAYTCSYQSSIRALVSVKPSARMSAMI